MYVVIQDNKVVSLGRKGYLQSKYIEMIKKHA